MVVYTLPYKPLRKLVPNDELPSVPPPPEDPVKQATMLNPELREEAEKQLRHAQEQSALTRGQYPGRASGYK
jgi:hypothetical protein